MQTQPNTLSSTRQKNVQRIQYTQKMRYKPTTANHREKRKGESMENSTDPGTIDVEVTMREEIVMPVEFLAHLTKVRMGL